MSKDEPIYCDECGGLCGDATPEMIEVGLEKLFEADLMMPIRDNLRGTIREIYDAMQTTAFEASRRQRKAERGR